MGANCQGYLVTKFNLEADRPHLGRISGWGRTVNSDTLISQSGGRIVNGDALGSKGGEIS